MSNAHRRLLGARQQGVALIVALVFLLLMTVLGVAAIRTTTLEERMAGNLHDKNLAFQAAEAGLRAGEEFLQQAALPQFAGSDGLLQMQDEGGSADFWSSYAWGSNSKAVTLDDLDPPLAAQPRYVIEELPPLPAADGSVKFGALPEVGFYRITARGVGGTADAVAILQTTYRR
jgi:type IV pilus assembly protein PilX